MFYIQIKCLEWTERILKRKKERERKREHTKELTSHELCVRPRHREFVVVINLFWWWHSTQERNKDDRHMLRACNSLGRRISQSISWSDFFTFILHKNRKKLSVTYPWTDEWSDRPTDTLTQWLKEMRARMIFRPKQRGKQRDLICDHSFDTTPGPRGHHFYFSSSPVQ